MVKVACFQATALDDQWPRCSRLRKPLLYTKKKDYFASLFDLKNKAYELSVLWQRSRHAKEPNRNGSKPSFSFLVKFYLFLTWEIVVDPAWA